MPANDQTTLALQQAQARIAELERMRQETVYSSYTQAAADKADAEQALADAQAAFDAPEE